MASFYLFMNEKCRFQSIFWHKNAKPKQKKPCTELAEKAF